MSRSVSAPSSVTKTSPCWNGLIVPGSTLMYGSNFCTETFRPRAFKSRPSDAAVIPLPSDETTPPVTNTYLVIGSQPPPGVDLAQDRRALDQRAQRAPLPQCHEGREPGDQAPAAPCTKAAYGPQG